MPTCGRRRRAPASDVEWLCSTGVARGGWCPGAAADHRPRIRQAVFHRSPPELAPGVRPVHLVSRRRGVAQALHPPPRRVRGPAAGRCRGGARGRSTPLPALGPAGFTKGSVSLPVHWATGRAQRGASARDVPPGKTNWNEVVAPARMTQGRTGHILTCLFIGRDQLEASPCLGGIRTARPCRPARETWGAS